MTVVTVRRRFAALFAAALICSLSVGVVLAGSGDSGSIAVTVPNHLAAPNTVSLSGTWTWSEFKAACGPGTAANRAAGWAIDWGDGFTGNRVQRKDSKPASFVHLGTASDNVVHHSAANSGLGDCGSPVPGGVAGTWGPITHTYPGPGTYTACVSIYDIHYKNVERTKLSAAITTQSTFGVKSAAAIAIGDVLLIDKEQMVVTGKAGNTITVTRGANGTAVANHKKDAVVSAIVPSNPKQLVAGSNAPKYTKDDHNDDSTVETKRGATAQCRPITFRVYGPTSINVVKSADVSQAHVGDTVTYTFVVTNTGDAPLTVQVTDAKCDPGTLGPPDSGDTNLDTKLDKTETWTYSCSHVVVAEDGDLLQNTVTVDAVDPFGTFVSDNDANAVAIIPAGSLHLTKAQDGGTPTDSFTFQLTGGPASIDATKTNSAGDGVFDWTGLQPGDYTLCERSVPLSLRSSLVDPPFNGTAQADGAGKYKACVPVTIAAEQLSLSVDNATDTTDLQITKTDGIDSMPSGTTAHFTIVVTNAGFIDVTGAIVHDGIVGDSTSQLASWEVDPTGTSPGAVCTASCTGGGIMDAVVDLPAGGHITFKADQQTGGPGGPHSNTATVTAPAGITDAVPGNNSATDTNDLTTPVDLAITKTDGVETVTPGQLVTYTIVVANHGPHPATPVQVTDPVPTGLTNVSWTAVGTGGTFVQNTSGSGGINEEIGFILAGDSVTYTVTATVAAEATGSIVNIANVSLGNDDPNTVNNTATDTDLIFLQGAAVNDEYTGAIGNTKLAVGVTVTGEPVVSLAGSVLDNDGAGTLTAELLTPNPVGGRIVTMNTDGTFTYVPAPGFTGDDTFLYTLKDGGSPTGMGKVKVTVASMVWYVNNALAPAGDGRSTSPFNSLTALNGGSDPDGTGDTIFVYQGTGDYGPLGLEGSQSLLGQPNGLVVGATTLVTAGGTNPVMKNAAGHCITLASGDIIKSISAVDCGGSGISGSDITGLTVANSTIEGATVDGIALSNATGVSLFSLTIKENGGQGLRLGATGTGETTATVTGGSFTSNAFYGIMATASGAGELSLTVTGGTYTSNLSHITLVDNSSGEFTFSVVGTTMSTTRVDGSAPINARLQTGTGVASLMSGTVMSNVITNNDVSIRNGIDAAAIGDGHLVIKIASNTISQVAGNGVFAVATSGSGDLDATITNNSITLGSATALDGIQVMSGASSSDTTSVCAGILLNTVSTAGAGAVGIGVHIASSGQTLRLPGYPGSPTNDAAVEAFLMASNFISSADASHAASIGFVGGGACQMP